MKVKKEAVVGLLVAMGYKTAAKFTNEGLGNKIKKIEALADDCDESGLEPAHAKLLARLKKAVVGGEAVEILDGSDTPTSPVQDPTTPAAPGKKKPGKKTPPETPPAVEPEPTDPPKRKVGRPAGSAGTGVIATIQKILSKATAKKPLTKEQIHAQLVELFPDRNADSLKTTVGIQVPSRLKVEKGMNIQKNDGGYYVVPPDA